VYRDVAAGAVVPGARDAIPALDRTRDGANTPGHRCSKLPVFAVHLDLRLLGKLRDHVRMPGREGHRPGAGRTAARDFDVHPGEGRQVELEAAKPPRLQQPVKAGRHEPLVDLVEDSPCCFRLSLLIAQERAQRRRALDHLSRRQVGFRHGDPAGLEASGRHLVPYSRGVSVTSKSARRLPSSTGWNWTISESRTPKTASESRYFDSLSKMCVVTG
jgi:hypothetical protein